MSSDTPTPEPGAIGRATLHQIPVVAAPDVIATLREMLARAEAGEIIAVGIAYAKRGRIEGTAYALGDGDIAGLVLATRRLEYRLLNHEEP